MTIKYALTLDDYIAFNLYHLSHSPSAKRNFWIQRFIVPILYIILPFTLLKNSQVPLPYWIAIFSVVSIIWVIYYPKRYHKLIVKRITKMVNDPKNKHFTQNNTLTLLDNDAGFLVKSGASETKVLFSDLVNVVDRDAYLYLYIGDISAFILPKRIFESQDHLDTFIENIHNQKK